MLPIPRPQKNIKTMQNYMQINYVPCNQTKTLFYAQETVGCTFDNSIDSKYLDSVFRK